MVDGFPDDYNFHLGPVGKRLREKKGKVKLPLSQRQREVLDFAIKSCRGASLDLKGTAAKGTGTPERAAAAAKRLRRHGVGAFGRPMRLILATNHLGLGGSESYLFTVAEELDRLGHEAAIYTPDPGAGATAARRRGIAVVDDLDQAGRLRRRTRAGRRYLASNSPRACRQAPAALRRPQRDLRPPDCRRSSIGMSSRGRRPQRPRRAAARGARGHAARSCACASRSTSSANTAASRAPDRRPARALLSNNPVADRLRADRARLRATPGSSSVRLGGERPAEDPRAALARASDRDRLRALGPRGDGLRSSRLRLRPVRRRRLGHRRDLSRARGRRLRRPRARRASSTPLA